MHAADNVNIPNAHVDDDDTSMQEMFCAACNIQFSSMKTYNGHKEFYCSMRNNSKQDIERSQRDAAAQVIATRQVLANGVPPPGTILPPGTAFPVQGMLPNGSIAMPLAQNRTGYGDSYPCFRPQWDDQCYI